MTSLTPPGLKNRNAWLHLWLLLGWLALGTGLRFYHLEFKPPWSDEWATIVFSLGHSFRTVPLDRVISAQELLQPLQVTGTTQPGDVIDRLMAESTHPPLYFVLTHLWLKLFSSEGSLVSLWAARSPSALFGVVSIPAAFGLGWLAFRSLLVAQLAAALMAVSPFGIYLAQESRHYTISILWIIASLVCFIVAVRHVRDRIPLPIWIVLVWVAVNSLGIATHYFFALTLMAQMLVLIGVWLADLKMEAIKKSGWAALFPSYWLRIYAAVAGTAIGGAVWLSAWRTIPEDKLVDWIYRGEHLGIAFLEPIGRLLLWIITMLFLLPVEGTPRPVTITSAVVILLFLCWLMPAIVRYLRAPIQGHSSRLEMRIFEGFIVGAIALILLVTYTLGTDLSLAARYQFIYFPAVILLMAAVLAQIWQQSPKKRLAFKLPRYFPAQGKGAVVAVLLMSLLGGLTVVGDFGFQKPDRPDLVVTTMLEAHRLVSPDTPIFIANLHKTHEQTGEIMGLAWEFERMKKQMARLSPNSIVYSPQFLLAHQANEDIPTASQTLHKVLPQLARPFQLWLVNFPTSQEALEARNCARNLNFKRKVYGYHYSLYYCQ
ncbi:putative membrane protein [Pleurocapsa sp. PCC 7327]|uniref:glycosyltransferase family 39 protein n=1 Tax=Pleurocapsa sp. PCC 7327 TaxID=118163 RepID=UPI00029FE54B|nr:glycosyltransferase family 39 protein [Pleurocapsa sp. PCC 7327]AFY76140.1 putative membrane protein [Pleurocapsa sp. PCC 7327]